MSVELTDGTSGPDSIVGKLRRAVWGEYLGFDPNDQLLLDPFTHDLVLAHRKSVLFWQLYMINIIVE